MKGKNGTFSTRTVFTDCGRKSRIFWFVALNPASITVFLKLSSSQARMKSSTFLEKKVGNTRVQTSHNPSWLSVKKFSVTACFFLKMGMNA